jgi:hypothetical protein
VKGASFFNRDLLKDGNFVTGLLFAFIVGISIVQALLTERSGQVHAALAANAAAAEAPH